MRYTGFMRAELVLVAVAGLTLAARPLLAAPPADLPTYCRSTQPTMQAQVRCLYTEKAAQDRAAGVRAAVTPDAWGRCESSSASWTAMESCLANARAGVAPSAGGTVASPSGGGDTRPDPPGTAAVPSGDTDAPGATAAAPPVAATPPPAVTGTPSTVILGPQGGAASAVSEPARPTRPVTEAEAERHLKGVLERSGDSQAQCTKKEYKGGWVTVCQ